MRNSHEEEEQTLQFFAPMAEQIPFEGQEDRRDFAHRVPGRVRHLQPELLVLLLAPGGQK